MNNAKQTAMYFNLYSTERAQVTAAIESVGIRPNTKQSWCDLTRGCNEDCSWLIEQGAMELRQEVSYWYGYANHEGQRHLKLADKILTAIIDDLKVCKP